MSAARKTLLDISTGSAHCHCAQSGVIEIVVANFGTGGNVAGPNVDGGGVSIDGGQKWLVVMVISVMTNRRRFCIVLQWSVMVTVMVIVMVCGGDLMFVWWRSGGGVCMATTVAICGGVWCCGSDGHLWKNVVLVCGGDDLGWLPWLWTVIMAPNYGAGVWRR
ncbi:Hypothetical predicted protein [Olea europaea subsp. europaea]|uniref:Transmembrane protein n=1 Tax=Olea europaea subsp. europaea TaxID=158383 RepID=A0A8S0RM22_OLEEU|nr:Hypothetical predicted protein [Olea europaea subsp. europaea]